MRTQQLVWSADGGWNLGQPVSSDKPPNLVLVFGGREAMQKSNALNTLAAIFPKDRLFGCSTAGEIADTSVHDDHIVATALWLDRAWVKTASIRLVDTSSISDVGHRLATAIPHEGLVHAFVLADGTDVNGSELAAGLVAHLPKNVEVTGGLSGDGAAMKTTVVCTRGSLASGEVCIIGFYGPLTVGVGSLGGWDAFGPERRITKSSANVLHALDGEPALTLYKRSLGPHANQLPSSALLFPLLVRLDAKAQPVVRTILGVSEADGTMTFAGDVPEGATAQLMRANFDRLIGGAFEAAKASSRAQAPQLALLVSGVGRKLILKQRTEEEVEAVREVLGPTPTLAGFYSYGELAPFTAGAQCQLHNQTMTVTTFSEA